jgi:hypothetical protein
MKLRMSSRAGFAEKGLLVCSRFVEKRAVLRHDIIDQTKTWTNG